MNDADRARLASYIGQGLAVLFTGAGFSSKAISVAGAHVPTGGELARILWPYGLPDQDFDPSSSLAEIYDVAVRRSQNRVREEVLPLLQIQGDRIPDFYQTWFQMPWYRIYTLNVDDLDDRASGRFPLVRPIQSISALGGEVPDVGNAVLSVHLNGRVAEFPRMTFTQQQYAERAVFGDPWYPTLAAELNSRPVVFVGTALNEPLLWQHIELRRRYRTSGRELRPGSFLVTPEIPVARRAVLKDDYNIVWIPMDQQEFAESILTTFAEAREAGHRVHARSSRVAGPELVINRVADLRGSGPSGDEASYLLGRQPTWSDLVDGFSVEREFETDLSSLSPDGERLLVITGTGGSGKSTTLMRLALKLQATGADVLWLDALSAGSPWDVRKAVATSPVDAILFDDVDVYGDRTAAFVEDLLRDNSRLVVAVTMRGARYERFQIARHLKEFRLRQVTIPNLTDTDINGLIDALASAKRLGALTGLDHAERVKAFRERARRQLLVAMIEVTSGLSFEEKVARECRELEPELAIVYAIAAVATAYRHYLLREEILLALGDSSNEALSRIDRLLNQRLLVPSGRGVAVRHRVIAERSVRVFAGDGQLAEPLRGLAFAVATRAVAIGDRHSREWRLLMQLISHERLLALIGPDDARAVYAEVEKILDRDYHFWLQRGSLEVEDGSQLSLARNFLSAAMALGGDDYRVQTEWAYLNLKQAAAEPRDPDSRERADQAIRELEGAIAARGDRDSYPYHVLGSQGLRWVRRSHLSRDEKVRVVTGIRAIVKEGVRKHGQNAELKQLDRDIDQAFMLLAVQE